MISNTKCILRYYEWILFNPLTSTACKISGLEDARTHQQTVHFPVPCYMYFQCIRVDESPFTCLCEKEDGKAHGFQIVHFYWPFSSDIMAMKGLNQFRNRETLSWPCWSVQWPAWSPWRRCTLTTDHCPPTRQFPLLDPWPRGNDNSVHAHHVTLGLLSPAGLSTVGSLVVVALASVFFFF